jgi:hypothetical protein
MISLLKHIVRGLARRLTQFKRAQNWAALLSALLEEIQELEEAAVGILEARNLDDATGDHLDLWGRLVGEYRLGKTDVDYRRFIKARLLRNTSQGNPDRQIVVLDLLTNPTRIILEELYPAQTRLWFLLDTNAPLDPFGTTTENTLSEIMKDIGPLG